MAVYNGDDPVLFERAVNSVYANSLKPDDFVLIVDGPVSQNIDEVIVERSRTHAIRVLRLPKNVGLAHALNRGLAVVRTAWVLRADADDVNLADRFECQAVAVFEAGDAIDIVGGLITEVDKAGRPLAVRRVPLEHNEICRQLRTRNPFNHMTVAYRTASALAAGGYPGIVLKEDWALWAAMLARGARSRNVDRVLVLATTGREMYRRRGRHSLKSEWQLQSLLRKLGYKGFASALWVCALRVGFSLLPAAARGLVYERVLRKPPGQPPDSPDLEAREDSRAELARGR